MVEEGCPGGEGCEDAWGDPRWGGRWSRQGLRGEQPAGAEGPGEEEEAGGRNLLCP